ncbi:Crp/Fnr family transcriptional regulator [Geofilum sp. OHC36d9]|uniref:Crp/Fnr family transcriptional regulator n=1 Tax=Geofilum sp. OHC36d9 TaxID=3458413 RepID=UPI0040332953
MNDFIEQADFISPLSTEAKADLMIYLKQSYFEKGKMINQKGKISRRFYFIESGLLKHYYYYNGNQFILRFFCEKRFATISDSFLKNIPAEYSTIALEDTTLIYLEYDDLEKICAKHHSFEHFIRIVISNMSIMAIDRLKSMLHLNATERYQNYLTEYGHLQQRISLGDTASFLGISQVSLSRLRARK